MKLHDITNLDKDDFLGLLGLETKHPMSHRLLGTLGTFAIGLLVGAGAALLLAPKLGSELRHDLRTKLHRGREGSAKDDKEASASQSTEQHA
jgi:gas vesicle protein